MSEEMVVSVPIESIRISPFQPRREFADKELDELVESFKSVGLIQPPVVRAIRSKNQILYYELIAGERRWRAAKRAKWESLPVIVREYDDIHAAESTLIENIQRVDLDPIELAHAFKKLIDVFRLTQEEVAERVGKKRSTVANYLRLLTLPNEMQRSISIGEISMGHAKAILAVDDPEQRAELKEQICKEKMTVRDAEKRSRAKQENQPDILDIEQRLSSHLQAKVKLNHLTNGSGQITLYYQDLDDLDQLLEKLQAGSEASSFFV